MSSQLSKTPSFSLSFHHIFGVITAVAIKFDALESLDEAASREKSIIDFFSLQFKHFFLFILPDATKGDSQFDLII